MRRVVGAKFVKFVNKQFDLGRRCPVLHLDAVNDGTLLHESLILFNLWLLQINCQSDVTAWTIRLISRANVATDTCPTKVMLAATANRILGRFIAYATDKHVLTALSVLLENK